MNFFNIFKNKNSRMIDANRAHQIATEVCIHDSKYQIEHIEHKIRKEIIKGRFSTKLSTKTMTVEMVEYISEHFYNLKYSVSSFPTEMVIYWDSKTL
jgi:hypothetical protein